MTFHIKIMVAHQHDQSIFTWGKLPPLLLCMRMSRLMHKKGERIKKRKSCQPFLSANKEESAVGQITDVLPHKNDHYCAKILSDFLACFHSELCHKRFWQACPSIRQTHTMRDSVRAQAVPTWWPSPGTACCSARCKNCQYKTIYLFSDRIYGITAQTALLKCLSLCEAAPLCASDFRPVICYPVGLWQNLITNHFHSSRVNTRRVKTHSCQ